MTAFAVILSCFLVFGASYDHAIYIGMVELHCPEGRGAGEMRVKVFHDDFQDGVRNAFPEKFRAADPGSWLDQNQALAEAYFRRHLICRLGGKPVAFNLVRAQQEQDIYLFEFHFDCPNQWNTMSLRADFLTELFPAQSNVVQCTIGAQPARFGRVTKAQPEWSYHR